MSHMRCAVFAQSRIYLREQDLWPLIQCYTSHFHAHLCPNCTIAAYESGERLLRLRGDQRCGEGAPRPTSNAMARTCTLVVFATHRGEL